MTVQQTILGNKSVRSSKDCTGTCIGECSENLRDCLPHLSDKKTHHGQGVGGQSPAGCWGAKSRRVLGGKVPQGVGGQSPAGCWGAKSRRVLGGKVPQGVGGQSPAGCWGAKSRRVLGGKVPQGVGGQSPAGCWGASFSVMGLSLSKKTNVLFLAKIAPYARDACACNC